MYKSHLQYQIMLDVELGEFPSNIYDGEFKANLKVAYNKVSPP